MAQWLAQMSYTHKVEGSNPSPPTNIIYYYMKEEASSYYKERGFKTVYIGINKDPRRVATLRKENGETLTMSYAKYLYTSYYKCDVVKEDHVDHINGNKMDDRIENLQVIL